jgi:hypothetical protein
MGVCPKRYTTLGNETTSVRTPPRAPASVVAAASGHQADPASVLEVVLTFIVG